MNRNELKRIAEKHEYIVSQLFDIKDDKSFVYYENSKFDILRNDIKKVNIKVVDLDTISAIERIESRDNKKIGILNFASYKNPGGGYMNGSMAQEEALCHKTNLYSVLSSKKFNDFYEYNRNNVNNGLYKNRAIYSPEIEIIDSKIKVAVVSCASPNRSVLLKYNNINENDNINALEERIEFVLDIFESNNINILVLGAFGCGVFKQDAKNVSSIFKEKLNNRNFEEVIFAIPNKNSYNFREFFYCFNNK